MWSDRRSVNLDAVAASGIYQPPILLRSFDAPRPRIRSIVVINQSPNTDVGICFQMATSDPDFTVPAQYMMVVAVPPTDAIAFVFSLPTGGRQSGKIMVCVTEESLAASSSVAPASGTSGAFVIDISSTDSDARVQ